MMLYYQNNRLLAIYELYPHLLQGPSRMTTETAQQFKCKHTGGADCSKLSKLPIGLKEESGFVHNINVEPVTFIPGAAHSGSVPGWYTNRPTGVPITTTDYRPSAYPKVW